MGETLHAEVATLHRCVSTLRCFTCMPLGDFADDTELRDHVPMRVPQVGNAGLDVQFAALRRTLDVLAMPLTVHAQRGPRRSFLLRARPVPSEQVGELAADDIGHTDAVLALRRSVEERDAPRGIHRDHRVAASCKHLAAEAVLLDIET